MGALATLRGELFLVLLTCQCVTERGFAWTRARGALAICELGVFAPSSSHVTRGSVTPSLPPTPATCLRARAHAGGLHMVRVLVRVLVAALGAQLAWGEPPTHPLVTVRFAS